MHIPTLSITSLWRTFYVSSAIYLISLFFNLPIYPAALLKVIPLLSLLWISLQSIAAPKFLSIALAFSALGDLLLALPLTQSFVFGLSAFLVAQLVYAFGFLARKVVALERQHYRRLIFVALVCVCMATLILPNTGGLILPVAIYLLAIASMAVAAALFAQRSAAVFSGALLFVLSDGLIAINKFIIPFVGSDFAIMATYYSAQALITYGVMRYHR